ncbi:MAG TPA: hypothetical protein VH763_08120 [Gemmatimonadales bacterium]|jgi:hypothetical protein
MRRTLGLVIFFGGLAGCGSSPADNSSPEPGDPGSSPGSRVITFLVTQKVLVEFQTFLECANGGAGELVDFSGTLNDMIQVTLKGNQTFVTFHDEPEGIFGVGMTTGDEYRATEVTRETTRVGIVGLTDSFVNHFTILGRVPGNNLLIGEDVHVTINGNRKLTAVHDHFMATCI